MSVRLTSIPECFNDEYLFNHLGAIRGNDCVKKDRIMLQEHNKSVLSLLCGKKLSASNPVISLFPVCDILQFNYHVMKSSLFTFLQSGVYITAKTIGTCL